MYNIVTKDIKQKHIPIRMCIACRSRISQRDLIRLQCIKKEIIVYSKRGRSFYICKKCLKNIKKDKLAKSLQRYCKIEKEQIINRLNRIIEGEDI